MGGGGPVPGMECDRGDRFMMNSVDEVDALMLGGRLWQESHIGTFADLIHEAITGPTEATIEACRPVSGAAWVT